MITRAAAQAVAPRVAQLLDAAAVEPDGLPPSAILVIRSLHSTVPGTLSRGRPASAVAAEWQRSLRGAFTDAWRAAARPDTGPVPAGANAVLFTDTAALLAAFTSDVLRGAAARQWWWTALRREIGAPDVRSLTALWLRHAQHAPAALAALSARGAAVAFVARFTPGTAAHLLGAIAEAHGVSWSRRVQSELSRVRPVDRADAGEGYAARSAGRDDVVTDGAQALPPPWEPLVSRTEAPVTLPPAQRALLGCGLLLQRAPLLARSTAFAAALESWRSGGSADYLGFLQDPTRIAAAGMPARALSDRRTSAPGGDSGEAAPSSEGAGPVAAAPLRTAEPLRATGAPRRADPPVDRTRAQPATPLPPPSLQRVQVSATSDDAADVRQRAAAGAASADSLPAGAAAAPELASDVWLSVHSGLCGVFFLINALRAERVFDTLDRSAPVFASGWAWLELLARLLGGRGMPPHDPVWRLIAVLDGRPPDSPILPGHVAAETLRTARDLAAPLKRRLHAALRHAGAVGPLAGSLLQRAGIIHAGRTHVDVMLPLDGVSVPVRIAGLDANPGWVPALGRVITFHYD